MSKEIGIVDVATVEEVDDLDQPYDKKMLFDPPCLLSFGYDLAGAVEPVILQIRGVTGKGGRSCAGTRVCPRTTMTPTQET
jgi:hypothetical protein